MSGTIFTNNLIYLREKVADKRRRSFTQKDLAIQLGFTVQSIMHWENGTAFPNESNLRKLAEFFSQELDIRDITAHTLVRKNLVRHEVSKRFQDNLLFLRRNILLMTKGDMISQLNIPKIVYYDWERGIIPERDNLQRLADFFSEKLGRKITPKDLLETDLASTLTSAAKERIREGPLSHFLNDHGLMSRLNPTKEEIQDLTRIVQVLGKNFTKKGLSDLLFLLRNETL